MSSIVWFRNDLRLADHPALRTAMDAGGPIVPVFIWAPEEESPWEPGAASRWWLHQSLLRLEESLRSFGVRLIVRKGPSTETLLTLAKETGASAVFWNRRYEPAVIRRDTLTQAALRDAGLEAASFNAALLHEPWTIQNKSGKPFQVFTPYWRHCLSLGEPAAPIGAPRKLTAPSRWPASLALDDLALEPRIHWTGGLEAAWHPGEAGAQRQLTGFLEAALGRYDADRNLPGTPGTSRLSPHLHFGEISPRQIWQATAKRFSLKQRASGKKAAAGEAGPGSNAGRGSRFLAEIGWREFAHHLLFHFPETPEKPLRTEFNRFRWRNNAEFLEAWQRGRTGYPIVDAGMRELWTTGWMHNRVRMIVGSFLVKDLLVSWREGAAWFWDTLVDADLAQNTLGWQWTAGCGADAAPYFRVFNPVAQGEKFDPRGVYVRFWCPELSRLPDAWLHRPWEAPEAALAEAGVILGKTYPHPLVSHSIAREVALETFAKLTDRKV